MIRSCFVLGWFRVMFSRIEVTELLFGISVVGFRVSVVWVSG